MTTIYDQIYQRAKPYWQTRQGEIHMPRAYEYARRLLAYYPEADEAVVLPAIFLHDVGYSLIPDDLQMQALIGGTNENARFDVSRRHEIEGARIAGEILAGLNYAADKIAEIQLIIDGHDTRREALSLNDKLVKDADKLWRFDPVGVPICARWNERDIGPYLDFVETRIETWLFTDRAREVACTLLAESRRQLDKTIYDKIYQAAEPYWNTRHNDIHLPLAYDFAKRLLTFYPQADESIVLPAILLHDIGWKMVPEEKQRNAFGPQATDKAANRLHEVEGVRIAGEILAGLEYDSAKTEEILTIIDGHDSRLEALSLNDNLVKDADKLWRFTPTGVGIDYRRFGVEVAWYLEYLSQKIEEWFFTPEAKEMARADLARTKEKIGD
ncbi:MAG: HD domain-containing protein [Anaerolineae bacterium]